MAKATTVDPAALGASILVNENDDPIASTHGEPAPPLLHHEPMPPPPSMGQQQKQRRLSATAAAPQIPPPAQPRKDIARIIPSSHRVYVYKRKDDGKQPFINEYSAQELQGVGTIEAFVKKYVVPKYGFGDYVLYYFDPTKKELDPAPMGSVTIDPPIDEQNNVTPLHPQLPPQRPEPRLSDQLREMLEVQRLAQPKSPMDDMMAMMMKNMMEKHMASATSGEAQKDGGMMPMLMMFMMERMSPKQDSGVERLIEKMIERMDRLEEEQRHLAMVPPPSPSLPPPPEGPSPIELLLQAQQENTRLMIAAMQQTQQNRDPIKDMAELSQLLAPKHESLTTADLFKMLPQMRDMLVPQGASKDPFEKTIENFRLFKMMQREFAESSPQQSQQQDQDNFWSFAKGLLQSDVGKSIAAQIMQQGAANEMAQHQQQRIAQQQAQARAVAQRRAQQAAQQRQLAETRAQQLTDGARRAEAEAKAAEKEAADAKARAEAEAQAAQAERRVAQAEQPQSQEDGDEEGLFVPPGFLEVNAQKINGASNDAELIGEIITGFQVLATSPDFRPVMTKMFGLCKLNRRIEALEHLREILEFFAENEVLDPAVIQRAVAGFDQHWKIIRARLEFPDVPEVFPEGHPQAVAAAPAKEEAVEAAQ